MLRLYVRLLRHATLGATLFFTALGTSAKGDMSVPAADLETFLSLPADTLLGVGNGPVADGSGVWTSFSVNAGDVLTFQYDFLTNEVVDAGNTINDFAFFTLDGNATPFADVVGLPLIPSSTGFASETGYQTFSFTFNQSGPVTFGIGVVNVTDGEYDSGLLLDGFRLGSALTTNGSFEAGNFTGFNTIGDTHAVGPFGVMPPDGNFQALLTTGQTAVPEPGSLTLLGIGAVTMLWRAKWRAKAAFRMS